LTTSTQIDTTVTISTLPNDYRYMLRAVDAAGNISLDSRVFPIDPPGAPNDLTAIGRDGSVDLAWNAPADGYVAGYNIYRKTSGAYAWLADTDASQTIYTDESVQNGTTYTYCAKAFDGAGNESLSSNEAKATPGETASFIDSHVVAFEDRKGLTSNDFDYNDIVVRLDTTFWLNASDQVASLDIVATAVQRLAGDNHAVYLNVAGVSGAAEADIRWYESGTQSPHHSSLDQSYVSGVANSIVLFTNTSTGISGSGGVVGDFVTIGMTLTEPQSNPLFGFDKAPFDTWIHNNSTGFDIHIFDPGNGDYAKDNQQVLNDADLKGVYLTLGLKIPGDTWAWPSEGQKLWAKYPSFVDYAKSVRTAEVEDANWYLFPSP